MRGLSVVVLSVEQGVLVDDVIERSIGGLPDGASNAQFGAERCVHRLRGDNLVCEVEGGDDELRTAQVGLVCRARSLDNHNAVSRCSSGCLVAIV